MAKPPAFQFYAKDWRSSSTVRKMTHREKGVYIELLSASWDQDEPGTLPLPVEVAAKCAGLDVRVVRNFVTKYDTCFVQVGMKLVNKKLHDQWLNYKEISEKRSNAAKSRYPAIAEQKHHSASASAFASASPQSRATPKSFGQQTPLTEIVQPEGFDVFWKSYPRKVAKPRALRAFKSAKPDMGELLRGLEVWKKSAQWQNEQYIPHPTTFLQNRMWNDRPPERKETHGKKLTGDDLTRANLKAAGFIDSRVARNSS